MDVLTLARLQFAFTIAFHYIYPPMSIGLGLLLVIMEATYLKTRLSLYRQMTMFWSKMFALTFAMGVATGIVMEFEFGTNWATYSRYVGDVFGSALAACARWRGAARSASRCCTWAVWRFRSAARCATR